MIRESIIKLAEGEDLTSKGMRQSMEEIMCGRATQAQVGAFLSLLKIKTETVNEITQAAKVMREKSSRIKISGKIMDTCSTGGTGINHYNISTAVAFIIAASGIKVAKHGNRAASGKCGSADVLEALGVKIDLEPAAVKKCIERINIGFLFAPKFHKAMKFAAPIRKEIGIRTIFNILGPLTNPATATHQILGVFNKDLTEVMSEVLGNLGVKRAMVVHGYGGLDEISLSGPTKVSELKNDFVSTYKITPKDFGLKQSAVKEISGGNKNTNALAVRKIFKGTKMPYRDVVLANAAASFVVLEKAKTLKEGVKIANEIIDSGMAMDKLEELIELSNKLGK